MRERGGGERAKKGEKEYLYFERNGERDQRDRAREGATYSFSCIHADIRMNVPMEKFIKLIPYRTSSESIYPCLQWQKGFT